MRPSSHMPALARSSTLYMKSEMITHVWKIDTHRKAAQRKSHARFSHSPSLLAAPRGNRRCTDAAAQMNSTSEITPGTSTKRCTEIASMTAIPSAHALSHDRLRPRHLPHQEGDRQPLPRLRGL